MRQEGPRPRAASARQDQTSGEDCRDHEQQQAEILLRVVTLQRAEARGHDQRDRDDRDDPYEVR